MKLLLSFARRLRRPLLVLGLVACLAGGAAWLLWPTDPIGPQAFDRIRLGMTDAEVEVAIGAPPWDPNSDIQITVGLLVPGPIARKGARVHRDDLTKYWYGDEFCIMGQFDETGAIVAACLWRVGPLWEQPSLLDRLRDWLGL